MNIQIDRKQESKSQANSSKSTQMQSKGKPTFQFVDNRPKSIQMRKLQDAGDNNPRAKQSAQLQAMAHSHSAQQQNPIQKKASPEPIQKENNTGLPDSLKSGVENLSGYSMDDVKVHYNSNKPAQLNAHAYAQGTDIHVASGQEKHLPHEAWHVVQQKQGRVKPTMQMKGKVNVNDDVGLEREADVMGAKAVQNSVSQKNTSSFAPVSQRFVDNRQVLQNRSISSNKQVRNTPLHIQMAKDKAVKTPINQQFKTSSVSESKKVFFENKKNILTPGKKNQRVVQGVFNLVGEIYDLKKEGELEKLLGNLTEENKNIFENALKQSEQEDLIKMGREKAVYDFIELLMNMQNDADYREYLKQDAGRTYQDYIEDKKDEKYGWKKKKDEEKLSDFPAHSIMPYEDRYLTKRELEASYEEEYEKWYKNPEETCITGAKGSAAGKNMVIDNSTWNYIKNKHRAKTTDKLQHRDAVSGSGSKETDIWYEVYDLLVIGTESRAKAKFNFHIGVLKNETLYSKAKNIDAIYKTIKF